ncbi:LytR family transcriptional regulator [Alteribacter lacisalsi]|uniref:Polyisoprenyl-teichoic acid--peptidoglycan teichoic acid transferase TagU n=1 Tax=Alteribacter lacisalsi TaxID=2045244 RepID=A0A2W0HFB2_9BACI|nr:LCP family protein [Alteribacter lacisalsi]PYZ96015.1 LytR family transcriptional regulator [Alteribacter lacisalsi]
MKKFFLITGLIMLLIIGSIAGYGFYMYQSVQGTVNNQMHVDVDREKSEKRELEVDIEEKEPLSFLLLGVDTDEVRGERGRTDTIMVVTVNPSDESMKMLSIPRDTRTEMVGRDFDDKINHAYAFGGPEMAMATVENFLDIPIDYFMTVNMDGFQEMVDALGGVTVNNSFAFRQNSYEFAEGEIQLDGSQALAYTRMRNSDPQGDLGRNARQREVLTAMIHEGAHFSSITRAGDILDALGNNIRTDLTFDKMVKIQSNYREARHNSETLEIAGSGSRIDNVWYYIVDEDERQRVSGELRTHLGLNDDQVVVNDAEEDEES